MIEFFSPDIEECRSLTESDSSHCCRVLRKKPGDVISVVDGKGNRFTCEIITADSRKTTLAILEKKSEGESDGPSVILGVAPTKNIDRIEWLIEKAVEIGVEKIYLVRCARSERKGINDNRLEKIAVAAMKQSLKAKLPELEQIDFSDFISLYQDRQRFIGYCSEKYPRADFAKIYVPGKDAVILIGPEGDFTSDEVADSVNAGYCPVTFGNNRLRTETAALYGLQGVHILSMKEQE